MNDAGAETETKAKAKSKVRRKAKRKRGLDPEVEPRPVDAAPDDPALAFVDAHLHLNDVEAALRLMDAHALPRAIVFWGRDSDNDSLAAAAAAHPGRFAPFYSVSPEREAYRRAWDEHDVSVLGPLDAALASGDYAGIGEISVTHFAGHGFPEATYGPLHPLAIGIVELARKHHVPVTVHCEATDIEAFERLLTRFANVDIIWAHGGYTDVETARRMLDAHPRLTYELSARTWLNHPRSASYSIYDDRDTAGSKWLALIEDHPTRFVVGTDAPLHSADSDRAKVAGVQRLLQQLRPDTRRRVAHDNITSLLGASG